MPDREVDVAVIGAGIAGIATAYYLCSEFGAQSVLLIDARSPMSYTSAQSGNNYRNWWPHPVMTAFVDASIDELERLARDSQDVFNLTRGGYALATRRDDIEGLTTALQPGVEVDVLAGAAVARRFPALDPGIRNVLHIRRGGDFDGQQLGQYLLERFAAAGGRQLRAEVSAIVRNDRFHLQASGAQGRQDVVASAVVNAAGPFADRVAAMLGETLPVKHVFQQKLAFEDHLGAIPRDMPFSIDLDEKRLDWSAEERDLLAGDPDVGWLTQVMPGGTHCRPEGGARSRWVKLGWAYNTATSAPQQDLANEPALDKQFQEIVMRGAAAFLPALRPYVEEPPRKCVHYGGYYTMTEENWPLIGPAAADGAFMLTALSGFGSMAACAAGRLCAATVAGAPLPDYARALSMARYADRDLVTALRRNANKGLL